MTTTSGTSLTDPPLPPPPPGPRTTSPRHGAGASGTRRSLSAIALALAGIVLAVVAWGAPTSSAGDEQATLRPTKPVDRIELTVEAGTIEVVAGDEVLVEATTHSARGGASVVMDSDLTAGRLRIDVSCSRPALLRRCRTPVRLVVPPGTPLLAATDAGTITASELTGGADLRTQAGTIDVRDLEGAIRLRSDAGSIRGSVRRGTVEADTTAGAIALTVTEDLTGLSATTEAGKIDLTVPDAAYDIDAVTGLGRTDVEVANTPGASRVIDARSEVGRVTIRTGD